MINDAWKIIRTHLLFTIKVLNVWLFTFSRNISMRSSTNFYLFNLAMADIILILMGKKNRIWHSLKSSCMQKERENLCLLIYNFKEQKISIWLWLNLIIITSSMCLILKINFLIKASQVNAIAISFIWDQKMFDGGWGG